MIETEGYSSHITPENKPIFSPQRHSGKEAIICMAQRQRAITAIIQGKRRTPHFIGNTRNKKSERVSSRGKSVDLE